jgi:transcriptional regulator with XRE-family HTH domain
MILTQNNERWRSKSTATGQGGIESPEFDKSVNYVEIGQRIRSCRLRTKTSQEKLAELAGISTSFLGGIERGEEILSLETLFRIANALRQPVSRLLLNANRNDSVLGIYDAVEEMSRSGDDKSVLLLNLLALLIDNSEKW